MSRRLRAIRPWRRAAAVSILALCILALALLSGPLFPFEPAASDVADVVAQIGDLDLYLREREARHAGVREELAKGIVWNDPSLHNRTPLSLVYLHGFSASRRDVSPVVEMVARKLKANAFFTRLAAHGLASSAEFAAVTPQDWLDDAREAVAIGQRIGERTILIGTSTGGLLATMVAREQPALAALALLSPNFALRDWRAQFLSGPLGPVLARVLLGRDYSFAPVNSGHAEFWTSRFPSQGIVALMDLENYARSMHLTNLTVPTLIIYTDKDAVVDVGAIRARYAEIPDGRKRIIDLVGATRHELTGAALAPDTVDAVVDEIVAFLRDELDLTPRSGAG
jgi:pimeloyl-ACP methyl ester carboxylesterase